MSGLCGVTVTPLQRFADERGTLHRMLRADDPMFVKFGEIYFSGVNAGVIKGWRLHRRLTSNLAVPFGRIRLMLFDDRPDSATKGQSMIIETGFENYVLVTVPPGIWSAWQGLHEGISLVANCATEPHDPNEIETAALDAGVVRFDWTQLASSGGTERQ